MIDPLLCGVLPIDKVPGMTSHDVVARVRRAFRPQKIKVGHAGTLDPDATGMLLVCIGPATRLADLLADQGKVYQAEFRLGVTTSTEDASGEILSELGAARVTQAMVEETLRSLTGEIQQVPPMVSAVHHEGRRLYDLARRGIEVERVARTIQVHRIELLNFMPATHPTGEMRIECGKGTYVRTLCADLGAQLGVGGHMRKLRRLSVGVFNVEHALPIDDITPEAITDHIVPASDVAFLPLRRISKEERADVLFGRSLALGEVEGDPHGADWLRLVDPDGALVALASIDVDTERLHPKKVLAQLG